MPGVPTPSGARLYNVLRGGIWTSGNRFNRCRRRRAEVIDADDLPLQADKLPPGLASGRLDRHAARDRRRQHAVAVGLVLAGECRGARHRHQAHLAPAGSGLLGPRRRLCRLRSPWRSRWPRAVPRNRSARSRHVRSRRPASAVTRLRLQCLAGEYQAASVHRDSRGHAAQEAAVSIASHGRHTSI